MIDPSDEEIAAEVEKLVSEVSQIQVRETFYIKPEQITVAIGHDLHSEHKFMNITFSSAAPDETGQVPTFDVALDFEAANKLVNQAMIVGYSLWGGDDDD